MPSMPIQLQLLDYLLQIVQLLHAQKASVSAVACTENAPGGVPGGVPGGGHT